MPDLDIKVLDWLY